jgi:hypothetical protein
MTDRNLRLRYFQEIEQQFRELLDSVAASLPVEQARWVQEFIDVGEYGLALEELCEALAMEGTSIPMPVYSHIRRVADKMGMPSGLWERLDHTADG